MKFLRGTESGWLQVEWGLVDGSYWEGYRETIKFIVGSEAGQRAFARNRRLLSANFGAEVERIIGDRAE